MRTVVLSLSLSRNTIRTWWSYLFLLFASLCAGALHAEQVSEMDARAVAQRFLSDRVPAFAALRSDDLDLVVSHAEAGTVYFRVFNAGANGFVIVSGDDVVLPILGWSNEGSFPTGPLLSNVAKWLEGYRSEIRGALEEHVEPAEEVNAAWQQLRTGTHGVERDGLAVNPLMQTLWDQQPNVNALCPGGSVTGCVATAMAQIMKFHNHPAQGAGFHSYNAPNYGTLSANFGSTTYNWTSMPNTVSGPNNAVATLMYHCGVSVDMQYSPQVSNAYVISSQSPIQACAEYAFKTYFGYSTNLQGRIRDNFTEQNWINMLRGELDASRPVFYGGFGSGGGHAFVCDGYDDSNFFHFNWGWGGQVNGYFQVGALNPGSTGTGGGTGGYNSGQVAITGITPATGGGGGGTQTNTMALYNFVTPSATTLYYGQGFSVSTNIVNNGSNGFSGDYAAAVFDGASNFYGFVQTLTGYTLPPGNAYNNNLVFSTSGLFSMVPGVYNIGIFYRPTGGEWVLVSNNGSYTNLPQVTVINPNDIELAAAMTVSPGNSVTQGAQISVNTNIVNDGFTNFIGQYGVAMYNLDGSWAQDIGVLNENNGLPPGYSYLSPFLTFGPATVTVPPGTYLIATQHNPNNTGWQLTGSSYFANPVFVTVVAAGLSPDQYEVNNAAGQAYTLPVNFSGNTASTATTGSNLHTGTDQDFYKVVLPAGNNYAISARIHDSYNSGNGNSYTVDGLWSYSMDGNTWSAVYDDVGPSEIIVSGGGTVYFHVAPYFAGETGSYLLQLNITRGADVGVEESIATAAISCYPNPANDRITIDLNAFSGKLLRIELFDAQGHLVEQPAITPRTEGVMNLDLAPVPQGAYMLRLATDKGVRNERIIITR
ncbi:MAG: thiol protease/hemagglutinin PrtT [Flavobacteriales bacterium]